MGHDIVSCEENSTQVADRLHRSSRRRRLRQAEARADGLVDPSVDDQARPILLAVSGQCPQMTSDSTREFMAPCAIACHFARRPSDQAWIESFFGHLKKENPHLLAISDPAVLRAELAVVRSHCNGVGLHSGMGYVCLDFEHGGKGQTIRKAGRPGSRRPDSDASLSHRSNRPTAPPQGPGGVG